MAKECLRQKQRNLMADWEAYLVEEKKAMELPKEKREAALAELKAKRVKKRLFKARVYNRCALTGRAHGYIGYFDVSRQVFREKAHRGELPGVRKSSW